MLHCQALDFSADSLSQWQTEKRSQEPLLDHVVALAPMVNHHTVHDPPNASSHYDHLHDQISPNVLLKG